MINMASVFSININEEGGVPKYPTNKAYFGFNNVQGDKQNDQRYHGGPTRAVCLFSLEKIVELQKEGHPISPGSTGENLTINGLDWKLIEVGNRYIIGDVEIEITGPAPPCKTISGSFIMEDFTRISEKKNPGWSRWYASVKKEGFIEVNDSIFAV